MVHSIGLLVLISSTICLQVACGVEGQPVRPLSVVHQTDVSSDSDLSAVIKQSNKQSN